MPLLLDCVPQLLASAASHAAPGSRQSPSLTPLAPSPYLLDAKALSSLFPLLPRAQTPASASTSTSTTPPLVPFYALGALGMHALPQQPPTRSQGQKRKATSTPSSSSTTPLPTARRGPHKQPSDATAPHVPQLPPRPVQLQEGEAVVDPLVAEPPPDALFGSAGLSFDSTAFAHLLGHSTGTPTHLHATHHVGKHICMRPTPRRYAYLHATHTTSLPSRPPPPPCAGDGPSGPPILPPSDLHLLFATSDSSPHSLDLSAGASVGDLLASLSPSGQGSSGQHSAASTHVPHPFDLLQHAGTQSLATTTTSTRASPHPQNGHRQTDKGQAEGEIETDALPPKKRHRRAALTASPATTSDDLSSLGSASLQASDKAKGPTGDEAWAVGSDGLLTLPLSLSSSTLSFSLSSTQGQAAQADAPHMLHL